MNMYPNVQACDDPIKEYIDYLKRATRTTNETLWQEHQKKLPRITAMENYGVTEEQLQWLDKHLQDVDSENSIIKQYYI